MNRRVRTVYPVHSRPDLGEGCFAYNKVEYVNGVRKTDRTVTVFIVREPEDSEARS